MNRQGHAQCDRGGVHSGIVLLSSVVQWWRDERRSSGGLEQMQVGAGAYIQHRSAGNGLCRPGMYVEWMVQCRVAAGGAGVLLGCCLQCRDDCLSGPGVGMWGCQPEFLYRET